MMNFPEGFLPSPQLGAAEVASLPMAGRWVMARLNVAIAGTNEALEKYDFSAATTAIYAFWQYDLCDVFIELMKPLMQSSDPAVVRGVWCVLCSHPYPIPERTSLGVLDKGSRSVDRESALRDVHRIRRFRRQQSQASKFGVRAKAKVSVQVQPSFERAHVLAHSTSRHPEVGAFLRLDHGESLVCF